MHTDCRADFDFLSDTHIISVGYDKLLYVFDCVLRDRISNSELGYEMSAISVHPVNRKIFAIGGQDKCVFTFENPELVAGELI